MTSGIYSGYARRDQWFDAERTFDKFQHTFNIKNLKKLKTKVYLLNLIKNNLQNKNTKKVPDDIIFNGPTKIGNKTRMSSIISLMSHNTGSFNQSNEAGKWNKMNIDYKINK